MRPSASARSAFDEKQGLVDRVFDARGAALRPDERPDVGRTAPAMEGCAGLPPGSAAQAAAAPTACSTWPAGPAISPSASPTGPKGAAVTVADINGEMLAVGRERAAARRLGRAADLRRGECRGAALCSPDRFDAVTIAFGIRNVPRIDAGARRGLPRAEARRTFPLPRILGGRRGRARPHLRPLFLQRDPGARRDRRRRRRVLPLPGRVDPALSRTRRVSPR